MIKYQNQNIYFFYPVHFPLISSSDRKLITIEMKNHFLCFIYFFQSRTHYLLMWQYISGFGIRKGLIKSEAALCRPLISNPVPLTSKGNASEVSAKLSFAHTPFRTQSCSCFRSADLSQKSFSFFLFHEITIFLARVQDHLTNRFS